MTMPRSELLVKLARWSARLTSVSAGLLLGAFLVEHMFEWVWQPTEWPPAWVLGVLALHAALVAGLLGAVRWPLLGGAVAILAALCFIPNFGRSDVVTPLLLITIIPSAIHLVIGGVDAGRRASGCSGVA